MDIPEPGYPDFPVTHFIHNRYYYGIGGQYSFSPNIIMLGGVNFIDTPKIVWIFDESENLPWDRKIPVPTDEREMSAQIGFTFHTKLGIDVSVFYRHGFWFSDTGAIAEIDPVKSVGVRVGYRFKVLDKLTLKRKRKIDCPKL